MKVKLREDSLGNLIAYPVSERIARAIASDMVRNGGPDNQAEMFLQQPGKAEVIETFGPRAWYRGGVNDGAVILMDNWEFRQYCGYSDK